MVCDYGARRQERGERGDVEMYEQKWRAKEREEKEGATEEEDGQCLFAAVTIMSL